MLPLKSIKNDKMSKVFSEELGDTRMESSCLLRSLCRSPCFWRHQKTCASMYVPTPGSVTRLWNHSSTSRKPRTGDKADRMDTPVHQEKETVFHSHPGDCAGLATYRCDDGRHTNGLLED